LPDEFQHHASREQLLAEAGIDAAGIQGSVIARWPQLGVSTAPLSAAG
jgi:1-deoxy-D-xylulose-5-phosphate synthase